MSATINAPLQVHLHAFDSAYPGSMSERADGHYVERDDVPSMLAALLERDREQTDRIEDLEEALRQIGDFAHDKSTGPAVPDALWEVRQMAYDALPRGAGAPSGVPVDGGKHGN